VFKARTLVQVAAFSVVSRGLLAIVALVLIRYMTPAEYARYIFVLSATGVLTGLIGTAFNNIYIVGHRSLDVKDPSEFLGMQLLSLSVLCVAALPFRSALNGFYTLAVGVTVSTALVQFLSTVYQQEKAFFRYSMVETVRALLLVVGTLALALLPRGFTAVNALWVQIAMGMVMFGAFFLTRLEVGKVLRVRRSAGLLAQVARSPYRLIVLYVMVMAVFGQLDVLLLQWLTDDFQLASYGAAFRYYGLLGLALGTVHSVFLPVVQDTTRMDQLDAIFRKHGHLVLVAIPVVLAGMAASPWIIPFIDAGKYPGSVRVFQILSVSAILSFAFSPHVHVMMRVRDFQRLVAYALCGLAVHLVASVALIRVWGAAGAAVGTLLAFLTLNGSIFLRARSVRRDYARHVAGLPDLGLAPGPEAAPLLPEEMLT
jgi:O-antigen/teichoic acid export membrane protein